MLSFNDFNKKIHNQEYEIVKSRSGLPMFVLDNPLIQDEDKIDEPVKIRTIPQQVQRVCDYITRHF